MNNMFWNLNSFDNAASFAGETTDVKTTYPRGIFIGLIMTVVFYVVPLMVAVGATDYTQSEWVDGHLGAVAVDIGGPWLGAWTIFAAGISNLALFEAIFEARLMPEDLLPLYVSSGIQKVIQAFIKLVITES